MKHLALDTNLLIYFFDKNSPWYSYCKNLLSFAEENKVKLSASELMIAEILAYPSLSAQDVAALQNKMNALPVNYSPITFDVLLKSAGLCRKYSNLRLPDAIHLATAIIAGADQFLTNDTGIVKYHQFEGLTIIEPSK